MDREITTLIFIDDLAPGISVGEAKDLVREIGTVSPCELLSARTREVTEVDQAFGAPGVAYHLVEVALTSGAVAAASTAVGKGLKKAIDRFFEERKNRRLEIKYADGSSIVIEGRDATAKTLDRVLNHGEVEDPSS